MLSVDVEQGTTRKLSVYAKRWTITKDKCIHQTMNNNKLSVYVEWQTRKKLSIYVEWWTAKKLSVYVEWWTAKKVKCICRMMNDRKLNVYVKRRMTKN